ncbi:DUF624 domain-containing protein [bacterium]|nr:DUF624 domain-containing protein [bacterium]
MTKEVKTNNETMKQYFQYYKKNFKFYFVGFCFAIGLFIILFVL